LSPLQPGERLSAIDWSEWSNVNRQWTEFHAVRELQERGGFYSEMFPAETMMTCGWYLGWVTVWELIGLAALLTLLWSVVDDEETPSTN